MPVSNFDVYWICLAHKMFCDTATVILLCMIFVYHLIVMNVDG